MTATSFIHDVFCKEVARASPVTVANAAVHLEISIDTTTGGISYRALMAEERSEKGIFSFKQVPCSIAYSLAESSLLQQVCASEAGSVEEFTELKAQIEALAAGGNEEAIRLLTQLPKADAFKAHGDRFKKDLKGVTELMKVLIEQLAVSSKLFTGSE